MEVSCGSRMDSNSTPAVRGVLWLRLQPQRPVVSAHLRHVRGRFRAAGWRVTEGLEAPTRLDGTLAVMADPWAEPLPEVAELLARADAGAGRWRVPRVNGVAPPQEWRTSGGPYTAIDYERMASSARGRGTARGVAAGPDPWCGFSVAAPQEAEALLASGWPPAPGSVVLVPRARLYRYSDPAAHERRELDRFVPPAAATIVDIGCGHGLLGARHRREGRLVIGIEPDRDLAREAARRLDLVLALEAEDGLEALRPGLDCLLFADVLEHTSDPAAVLEKAARVLSPEGRIVASLPNTAWAPVLRALAAGRWDPTLSGVQARDHLVPMTPSSFRRLAAECGFRVVSETRLEVPLPRHLRLWAWLVARIAGGSVEELLASQWIAVLKRRE